MGDHFHPGSSPRPHSRPRTEAVRALAEGYDTGPIQLTDPSARAWLREVVAGTLRRKTQLEWVLDSRATKKPPQGLLRRALLIACYQILIQSKSAPQPVVSEWVEWIKKNVGEAPAKFANAVLRRVVESREDFEREVEQGLLGPDAERWSCLPSWIWKRAIATYGSAWAVGFARASFDRPQLWVRDRAAGTPPRRVEKLEHTADSPRNWIVQDPSSQQIVATSTEILKQARLKKGLDLCAAPGGKAIAMAWNGFEVHAFDSSEHRRAKLRDNVASTGASVTLLNLPPPSRADWDWVWIDAPCTGTGTLRKHPEIRWNKSEKDLASLITLQSALLKQGWSWVRPGGVLIYSVCSILPEEGQERLKLAQLGGQIIKEQLYAPHLALASEPSGDGFYAAWIQKR